MPRTPRTDSPSKARVSPIRAILSAVAVFGGGILLAVTAAGGTYAIWNSSAPAQGATLASGTTGLTINNLTSVSIDLTGSTLLPGRSVVQSAPLQFKNTGVTPLRVTSPSTVFTPASADLQPHLQISLRPAVAATCTVTPEGSPLPAFTPVNFTVGQTVPMCLEVRLLSTAPASVQDATAAFTINLVATQVRP